VKQGPGPREAPSGPKPQANAGNSSGVPVSGTDAAAKIVAAQNEVTRFKSIADDVRWNSLPCCCSSRERMPKRAESEDRTSRSKRRLGRLRGCQQPGQKARVSGLKKYQPMLFLLN
jgi:hypothetical protein